MSETIKAGGQIFGGIAANSAAKFNAKIAENNASVAQRTAAENVKRQHRAGLREQGTIRAKNLSGLDFLQEAVAESKLRELGITHQGAIQAEGFRNQATLARYKGKAALIGASVSAASTLLTGATKAATGGLGGSGSLAGSGSGIDSVQGYNVVPE
jgi:hypothetical protein